MYVSLMFSCEFEPMTGGVDNQKEDGDYYKHDGIEEESPTSPASLWTEEPLPILTATWCWPSKVKR